MQDSHKDSTISYNQAELRIISLKLIGANECDTLLKVSKKVEQYKDSVIVGQNNIISKQEMQIAMYDTIVNVQTDTIQCLRAGLDISNTKLGRTRKVLYGVSVALLTSILYLIFKG